MQPSHGFHEGHDAGKETWLLVEWPEKTAEPAKYLFCDLPADYSLRRSVQVAKARRKIEQDYQQLKEELVLAGFVQSYRSNARLYGTPAW